MSQKPEVELQLYLTLAESTLILEALVEQPFKWVFELIGKLNQQAQQFYQHNNSAADTTLFTLSPAEFSCCITALGELPYNKVHALLKTMHAQLQTQQALLTGQHHDSI